MGILDYFCNIFLIKPQFVGNSEARIVCLRMAYQCVAVWRLACGASGVI